MVCNIRSNVSVAGVCGSAGRNCEVSDGQLYWIKLVCQISDSLGRPYLDIMR